MISLSFLMLICLSCMIAGQCICDVKQEIKVSSTSSRFEVRFYLSHSEFSALEKIMLKSLRYVSSSMYSPLAD